MKAILNGQQIAASDDIVETGGYHYFPPVRCEPSGWKNRRKPPTTWNVHMACSSMTW